LQVSYGRAGLLRADFDSGHDKSACEGIRI
jgi:hypothetical protein